MESILFIDACVREDSRTERLARYLLGRLNAPVKEVDVAALEYPVADEDFLALRDRMIAERAFDEECFAPAREFARAETIVIAAPLWDLSFPAALKQYFEQINVTGITFEYAPDGAPHSLCRAKRLYYVTTAGGPILSDEFGFGYVKALAQGYYQIPEVFQIKAEGLDIEGADVPAILERAEREIDRLVGA